MLRSESANLFSVWTELAAAVNHTCSFTDACVGGSESKITEKVCFCVLMCDTWVYVFVAEKWLKEKKQKGWQWFREGERARCLSLYLWSGTLMIAGWRWETDCGNRLKQREKKKREIKSGSAQDYCAGLHSQEQTPFRGPQADTQCQRQNDDLHSSIVQIYILVTCCLITVAYEGACLIYNCTHAFLISSLRHNITWGLMCRW